MMKYLRGAIMQPNAYINSDNWNQYQNNSGRFTLRLSQLLLYLVTATITTLLTLSEPTVWSNKLVAGWLVCISVLLVLKTRNNLPMFILSAFIAYVNYSIAVGEFFTTVVTSCPLTEVTDPTNYGIAIRCVLLFTTILFLFYKASFHPVSDQYSEFLARNDVAFYALIVVLLYFFFTGVNDIGRISYTVAITPAYEYSRVFFLFAFYFSGKSKFNRSILLLLTGMYILQDLYYGGRVTSLQLLIFLVLTYFRDYMTPLRVTVLGVIGLFLFAWVGAYRSSYSLSVPLSLIITVIFGSLFVFDTATYSFYASATHVATANIIGYDNKMRSFAQFLISIFTGASSNKLADATSFSNQYFRNVGGGIIATHFYFWGSWLLVILASFAIVWIINKTSGSNSPYSKLIFLSIVISTPRWYLYGPLVFFRGAIFVPSVLYFILSLIRLMTVNVSGNSITKNK